MDFTTLLDQTCDECKLTQCSIYIGVVSVRRLTLLLALLAAPKMRIQVLFNETSVLVPCGDGRLTVKELVDKAIVRFKKVLNKVCAYAGPQLAS